MSPNSSNFISVGIPTYNSSKYLNECIESIITKKNVDQIIISDDGSAEDEVVKIENIINDNEVLLFMKGTPVMPQCGFSAAVVGVLSHMGIKFNSVNVLEDPEIREGIKEFSDWPTIPQLYVKKEFVGGCDIIREMHENGELTEYFQEAGINS